MALPNDDQSDIQIGVSVNVETNNASSQVETEQKKIEAGIAASNIRQEAAQKASNARQEAEARRHAEAMSRYSGSGYGMSSGGLFVPGAFQQAASPSYMQSRPSYMPAGADEVRGARVAAIGSQNDLRAAQQLRTEQATQDASELAQSKIADIQQSGATRRAQINAEGNQKVANMEQERVNAAAQSVEIETAIRAKGAAQAAALQAKNDADVAGITSRTADARYESDQRVANGQKAVAAKIADGQTRAAAQVQRTQAESDASVIKITAQTDEVRTRSAQNILNGQVRTNAQVAVLTQRAETELQKGENLRASASIRMAQAAGGGYVYIPPSGARLAPGGGYVGGPANNLVFPAGTAGGTAGVTAPVAGTPAGAFRAGSPGSPGNLPPTPPAGGNWAWIPGRGGSGGSGGAGGLGGEFSADFFRNSGAALTQTLSTLQYWFVRLGEVGLRGLIAETTLAVGVIVKFSESFLKINEQFSTFELTLGSVFKSATDAQRVRQSLTAATGTSPVPFEGLSDLTKMLTVNPILRPQMVNQVQNGNLNDPNGFLAKNIHLMEQMLAYKPEAKPEDAIFSLREAMAGQFRSMTRRFDLPESTISAISGTSRTDLQNDPAKALDAIQKTFAAIIDPSAIRQMAQQPSKLFQNLLEQVFVIPLLTLGHDTRLLSTGKSLYDSILAPFQTMLKSATGFFSPNQNTLRGTGAGTLGGRPESGFQAYADQMAQPVYSIFTKVFGFLGDTMTRVLAHFGISVASSPNMSIWERISQIALSSVQALDKNIEPIMEKARDTITHFFEIFQKLVNLAANLVGSYGGFIADHPAASLAIAAGARPAIGLGVKTLASGYSSATTAAAAGGTGALANVGGFLSAAMPWILAAVLAAGVVALIVSAVHGASDKKDADQEQLQTLISKAATDTTPGAKSPQDLQALFSNYVKANQNYNKEYNSWESPDLPQAEKARDAAKQSLVDAGVSSDSSLFRFGGPSYGDTFDPTKARLAQIQGMFQTGINQYKSPDAVNLRNVAALNSTGGSDGTYERTPDSEAQYPALAALNRSQAGLLAMPNDETNQKMQAAREKLEAQLDPLKESAADVVTILADQKQIAEAVGAMIDTKGLRESIAKEKISAEAFLQKLKSNPVKDTDLVQAGNGDTLTYADAIRYEKDQISIRTELDGGISREQLDKYKTQADLLKARQKDVAANALDSATAALQTVAKAVEDYKGDPAQLEGITQDLADRLRKLNALPEQEISHLVDTFRTNVTYSGQNRGNQDLANRAKVESAAQKAADDMVNLYVQRMKSFNEAIEAKFNTASLDSFDISTSLFSGKADFSSLSSARSSVSSGFNSQSSPGLDTKGLTLNSGLSVPGVNGGDASQSNPLPVTITTSSGTVLTNDLSASNALFGKSQEAPLIPGDTPSVPSTVNPADQFIANAQSNGQTLTKSQIQSIRNQMGTDGGTGDIPIPAGAQDVQNQIRQDVSKTAQQQADEALSLANKQTDAAIVSLEQILSRAGDTGRGQAEGQVAVSQFNADVSKNPQLQNLLGGLSGSVDSLYTNVQKMGASGLDVTLQKLQSASQIATQISQTLADMAAKEAKSGAPDAQAQALKLQQASNQFATMAASYQDKYTSQSLSGDPISSFAQGFTSKAEQPKNYFTDLRTTGIEVAGDISNAFSNAFVGFINGTQTAGQAFAAFGKSVLDTIAKIASQRAAEAILNLVAQVGSSFFSTGASQYGGIGTTGAADLAEGHAVGGPIIGAGTSTSDSIPAYLSNGEHVWTAAEVRKVGGHHVMNQWRKSVRGYATGGFVSTGNASAFNAGDNYGGSSMNGDNNFNININASMNGGNSNLTPAQQRQRQRVMAEGLQSAVQNELKRQQRVSGSLYSTRYGNN